jgi:hypothetical protein
MTKKIQPWFYDIFIFWPSFTVLGSLLTSYAIILMSALYKVFKCALFKNSCDASVVIALNNQFVKILEYKFTPYAIIISMIIIGHPKIIRIIDYFRNN